MRSLFTATVFAFLLVAGCNFTGLDDAGDAMPPTADGLAFAESEQSAATTFSELDRALQAAGPVSVVARINHAANAGSVGMSLRPTRVILFGNPALGTPLMQADRTAGIDLPQKILVYENEGSVYASYNTTGYLAARHDVGGVETLPQIAGALQSFTEGATNGTVEELPASGVAEGAGLVSTESAFSVDSTVQRLKNAIATKPPVSVLAELDHAANAASVDMELPPTRLVVFGNPALGTPLMQAERSIAIDLPQKVLVYEDASGTVHFVYNDPFYLAARHGVTGEDDVLNQIQSALEGLAATATQAE